MKTLNEIHSKISNYSSDPEYLEILLDIVATEQIDGNKEKIKSAHQLIIQFGGYDNLFTILNKDDSVILNYKKAIMNRLQFIL